MSSQPLLDENNQVIDSPPLLVVENCRFEDNGFINVVTSESVMPGTEPTIIPVEMGACIYIGNMRDAEMGLYNSLVAKNYASKGGFIYVEQSEALSDFVIENSNVRNNFANQGSFAYFASPPDKTLFGPSEFYKNGKLSTLTTGTDLLANYGMPSIFGTTSEGSIIYVKNNVELSNKSIIIKMGERPYFERNIDSSYVPDDEFNTVLIDNCDDTILIGSGYDLTYTYSANVTVTDSNCQQVIIQDDEILSLN